MAAKPCKVHLLDVGESQYGDCVLIEYEGETILVDGGHRADFRGAPGHRSIPEQIDTLLGQTSRPHRISLMVVSHAHADHVGCLPEMVAQGVIAPEWALLTAPSLAWSEAELASDSLAGALFAALREEPRSDLMTEEAYEQFATDAAGLRSRYVAMISDLREQGTQVVLHGRDELTELHKRFKSIGLSVLGPSNAHLQKCREMLSAASSDFMRDAAELIPSDARRDAFALYSALTRAWLEDAEADGLDGEGEEASGEGADDAARFGSAVNMQSLVMILGKKKRRFLLCGDSQLERPEIRSPAVVASVKDMLDNIKAKAPYDFMKVSHHGSPNAFGDKILSAVGQDTSRFGICTGARSAHHPSKDTLQRLSDQSGATWARTDHNGAVTFDFTRGKPTVSLERGGLNDASRSEDAAAPSVSCMSPAVAPVAAKGPPPGAPQSQTVAIADAPPVEIRVPYIPGATIQVTVSFTGPALAEVRQDAVIRPAFAFGAGRAMPRLLLVTNSERLRGNVGDPSVDAMLADLKQRNVVLVDVTDPSGRDVRASVGAVRHALAQHQDIEGVVLVGGYDVVPSLAIDVLGPQAKKARRAKDADGFIVWSDWAYGDVDGDGLAEKPVSRVPDARSGEFLLRALSASAPTVTQRHGIRNAGRPFAEMVFAKMPGESDMLCSHPHHANAPYAPTGDAVYFMLHGAFEDPSRYWGERHGGYVEAVLVEQVQMPPGAVVLTGCCWGGLPVREPAAFILDAVTPLRQDESIALRCLWEGASAYVGCTGTHYSPVTPPFDRFGKLLHDAFWDRVGKGGSPAKALFDARGDFASGILQRHPAAQRFADIERKLFEQYTVLGLGW